jgi:exopolysaccharide biosynthesis polyprenyl glycosylphosphotransferase
MVIAAALFVWAVAVFKWLHFPLIESERGTLIELLIIFCALFADHLRTKDLRDDRLDVRTPSFMLRQSLGQTTFVAIAFFAYAFAVKNGSLSRVFLCCYLAALFAALLGSGWVLPRALGRIFFHGPYRTRTLLLGSVSSMDRYFDWIKAKQHLGIEIIGMVATGPESTRAAAAPFPILGAPASLPCILALHRPHAVVHLDLPSGHESLEDYRTLCDRFGARFLALCDFAQTLSRSLSFFFDDGIHVMAVSREPLQSPFNRSVKRVFDVMISLPLVCVTLPPLAVLFWFVHRLQSPGPLLHRQVRAGQNGTPFTLWKFRTMHTDNPDENRQATNGDPRIFAMGRWMRKLSLDEFPQFLNVLLGTMSIVGPRPHLAAHDDAFADVAHRYRVRSFVKPGITGLAQINGFRGETRTNAHIIDRVESDVFYLENWSILLDLIIVLKTIPQMILPPKTAY